MASYKDTFEAKTFAANSFACGTWRGTGVTVALVEGIEFRLGHERTHFALSTDRPHYRLSHDRMHYRAEEE